MRKHLYILYIYCNIFLLILIPILCLFIIAIDRANNIIEHNLTSNKIGLDIIQTWEKKTPPITLQQLSTQLHKQYPLYQIILIYDESYTLKFLWVKNKTYLQTSYIALNTHKNNIQIQVNPLQYHKKKNIISSAQTYFMYSITNIIPQQLLYSSIRVFFFIIIGQIIINCIILLILHEKKKTKITSCPTAHKKETQKKAQYLLSTYSNNINLQAQAHNNHASVAAILEKQIDLDWEQTPYMLAYITISKKNTKYTAAFLQLKKYIAGFSICITNDSEQTIWFTCKGDVQYSKDIMYTICNMALSQKINPQFIQIAQINTLQRSITWTAMLQELAWIIKKSPLQHITYFINAYNNVQIWSEKIVFKPDE